MLIYKIDTFLYRSYFGFQLSTAPNSKFASFLIYFAEKIRRKKGGEITKTGQISSKCSRNLVGTREIHGNARRLSEVSVFYRSLRLRIFKNFLNQSLRGSAASGSSIGARRAARASSSSPERSREMRCPLVVRCENAFVVAKIYVFRSLSHCAFSGQIQIDFCQFLEGSYSVLCPNFCE